MTEANEAFRSELREWSASQEPSSFWQTWLMGTTLETPRSHAQRLMREGKAEEARFLLETLAESAPKTSWFVAEELRTLLAQHPDLKGSSQARAKPVQPAIGDPATSSAGKDVRAATSRLTPAEQMVKRRDHAQSGTETAKLVSDGATHERAWQGLAVGRDAWRKEAADQAARAEAAAEAFATMLADDDDTSESSETSQPSSLLSDLSDGPKDDAASRISTPEQPTSGGSDTADLRNTRREAADTSWTVQSRVGKWKPRRAMDQVLRQADREKQAGGSPSVADELIRAAAEAEALAMQLTGLRKSTVGAATMVSSVVRLTKGVMRTRARKRTQQSVISRAEQERKEKRRRRRHVKMLNEMEQRRQFRPLTLSGAPVRHHAQLGVLQTAAEKRARSKMKVATTFFGSSSSSSASSTGSDSEADAVAMEDATSPCRVVYRGKKQATSRSVKALSSPTKLQKRLQPDPKEGDQSRGHTRRQSRPPSSPEGKRKGSSAQKARRKHGKTGNRKRAVSPQEFAAALDALVEAGEAEARQRLRKTSTLHRTPAPVTRNPSSRRSRNKPSTPSLQPRSSRKEQIAAARSRARAASQKKWQPSSLPDVRAFGDQAVALHAVAGKPPTLAIPALSTSGMSKRRAPPSPDPVQLQEEMAARTRQKILSAAQRAVVEASQRSGLLPSLTPGPSGSATSRTRKSGRSGSTSRRRRATSTRDNPRSREFYSGETTHAASTGAIRVGDRGKFALFAQFHSEAERGTLAEVVRPGGRVVKRGAEQRGSTPKTVRKPAGSPVKGDAEVARQSIAAPKHAGPLMRMRRRASFLPLQVDVAKSIESVATMKNAHEASMDTERSKVLPAGVFAPSTAAGTSRAMTVSPPPALPSGADRRGVFRRLASVNVVDTATAKELSEFVPTEETLEAQNAEEHATSKEASKRNHVLQAARQAAEVLDDVIHVPGAGQEESPTADTATDPNMQSSGAWSNTATVASRFLQACRHASIVPEPFIVARGRGDVLSLRHFSLGDVRCAPLISVLGDIPSLTHVDLCGNRLTPPVVEKIVGAFHTTTTQLRELDLSENIVGLSGGKALAGLLDGAKAALTTLRVLSLSNARLRDLGTRALLRALGSNSALTTLRLARNNIMGSGAEEVGEFLSKNNTLQFLDLSWNSWQSSGAEAIASGLAENNGLLALNLAFTTVGNPGAEGLAGALFVNTSLHALDLTSSGVRGRGAVALGSALSENTHLRALHMHGNPLGQRGVRAILRAAARSPTGDPRDIGLRRCDIDTVETDVFHPSEAGGTYTLDMSRPYDYAVLTELLQLANERPGITIQNVALSAGRGKWDSIHLERLDGPPLRPRETLPTLPSPSPKRRSKRRSRTSPEAFPVSPSTSSPNPLPRTGSESSIRTTHGDGNQSDGSDLSFDEFGLSDSESDDSVGEGEDDEPPHPLDMGPLAKIGEQAAWRPPRKGTVRCRLLDHRLPPTFRDVVSSTGLRALSTLIMQQEVIGPARVQLLMLATEDVSISSGQATTLLDAVTEQARVADAAAMASEQHRLEGISGAGAVLGVVGTLREAGRIEKRGSELHLGVYDAEGPVGLAPTSEQGKFMFDFRTDVEAEGSGERTPSLSAQTPRDLLQAAENAEDGDDEPVGRSEKGGETGREGKRLWKTLRRLSMAQAPKPNNYGAGFQMAGTVGGGSAFDSPEERFGVGSDAAVATSALSQPSTRRSPRRVERKAPGSPIAQSRPSLPVDPMGANRVLAVCRLMARLADPENASKFANTTLSRQEQQIAKASMGQLMTFSARNPVGHYRLMCTDERDREVLQRLLEVSNKQRQLRLRRGLGDVSHHGNRTNFRNERFDEVPTEVTHRYKVPSSGILEFDFTTTVFPTDKKAMSTSTFTRLLRKLRLRVLMPNEHEEVRLLDGKFVLRHMLNSTQGETLQKIEAAWAAEWALANPKWAPPSTPPDSDEAPLTVTDMARRERISSLLQERVAGLRKLAVKLKLTCAHVSLLVRCFPFFAERAQLDAICAIFGRITDLHNFEEVLRHMTPDQQTAAKSRLGYMVLWNPMKPDDAYDLDLTVWDQRRVAEMLVQLAIAEPGENWLDEEFAPDGITPIPGWCLPTSWETEVERRGRVSLKYTSDPAGGCRPVWSVRRDLCKNTCVLPHDPDE